MSLEAIRKAVVKKNHGWHDHSDNLGIRRVFLNGRVVGHVIRANERRGIVDVCDNPVRLDKHRKRVLTRRMRGDVRVEFMRG